ncbi:MAG: YggS family pyridoxal phosphate-dependent enzyme [Vampirovibrionales bacterium]|nr:YggS family pyridoxal phosphate-dependent enzyme [Vampirovibrionales bacterium]
MTFSHDISEQHLPLKQKLAEIHQEISRLQPDAQARLVAVTKYASPEQMIQLYEAGVFDFGENKIQDALAKKAALSAEIANSVTWHFIGHLQGNKVNKAVGEFKLIHSVDSLTLAEKINARAGIVGLKQKILCQINISGEESKGGFSDDATFFTAFDQMLKLPHLRLCGLMGIAPANGVTETGSLSKASEVFKELKQRFEQCAQRLKSPEQKNDWRELSMGMSQDYREALAAGATIIRLGQSLVSLC